MSGSIPISKRTDVPDRKKSRPGLSLGDSFSLLGILVGVFLVIIVPPLLLKAILLICLCGGVVLFAKISHWTSEWSRLRRYSSASVAVILLLALAIPQFVSQWKAEHPNPVANASSPANVPPQSAPSAPAPVAVAPTQASPPTPKHVRHSTAVSPQQNPDKPSQDNSVHIGDGGKVEQNSQGPCSPNIVGGSSTVNCTPPPPPPEISLQIGCRLDKIPIHISTASTIHVIRLYPSTLLGNPRMPYNGVFEDVDADAADEKGADWPSTSQGRWMNHSERKGLSTPFAYNCTLTNYGNVTLDEITVELGIATSDGKRHTYPIPFDPLISGHSFNFYMVNMCSFGVTPSFAAWDNSATVGILGEKGRRRVPLKFERRSWPSGLTTFGASLLIWDGVSSCQWD